MAARDNVLGRQKLDLAEAHRTPRKVLNWQLLMNSLRNSISLGHDIAGVAINLCVLSDDDDNDDDGENE